MRMSCLAIKATITHAFTRTKELYLSASATCFHQIYPTLNSHFLFFNVLHQRNDPLLLITSSFAVPKLHPVHLLRSYSYSSSSSSSTASYLFDKMSQRDQHLQDAHFHRLFHLLKSSSILTIDILTVSIFHCLSFKIGAFSHLPISTSLLTIYSKAGLIDFSWALFDQTPNKDVIIWNAMITAFIEGGYFIRALNLFVKMIGEEIGFDSITLLLAASVLSHMKQLKQGQVVHGLSLKSGMLLYSALCNSLMDMYAKCGNLSYTEHLFAEMGLKDLVSWNSVMSGCLYNDCPEKTLKYFSEMVSSGKKRDDVSLSCAISASTCLQELSCGQIIHGCGIKLGYTNNSHISVSNSLISLYSTCGDIEASETLFTGMIYKDVISWNAMIEGFVSNGNFYEAFDLLSEMQLTKSAQPDKVTVVSIMPLCAELMLLREGKTIHGFTIRQQMVSDLSVTNCLMNMYSKCKSVREAELLFIYILEKDLISWNTMISGYSQNGHPRKAQKLFKQLLQWCSNCSLSTLLAILPSCDSPECLHFGKSIHCWHFKLGFSEDILAVNSLMDMYINCGDIMNSFSLLHRLSAVKVISSWNTVIVGCTKNGWFLEALTAFNLMRQKPNINPDTITLVNVISACGNLGLVSEGKSLHSLALKTTMGFSTQVQNSLITMYSRCGDVNSAKSVFNSCSNHNLCSWNCMISALSQNKDGREALELFHRLESEPNEMTMASILSACTQFGLLRHGKQIHGYTFRKGFQGNCFVSAALLDMYSRSGRLNTAWKLFTSVTEKSIASWNCMISAFGYHSDGRKAIDLFHEMCYSATRPTKSTFISLLSACSHSRLLNEGLYYYDHMLEDYGVEPATEHHVCVVDMLGRSGKVQEAYEFIKQMPSQPEPGVWGALLSACNYNGDLKMGRKVAELLFKLEPENVGYYILLSNMYVAAGSWKDAVEMRQIIQDQQLRKPAGYSLIDVS